MDSQSIITQANRDESCTEFPILSLPRPVPPAQNTSVQGLLLVCCLDFTYFQLYCVFFAFCFDV